jgi:hypothetical protein
MAEDSDGRGRIGAQIFEQVEKLVAAEKITRSEAFKRISEETGRREGTVSANYYRIARQRGTTLQTRGRRGPGRPRGRAGAGTSGAGDVAGAISRVTAALTELQAAVRRQESELSRLREENSRFDEIRRLARRVS